MRQARPRSAAELGELLRSRPGRLRLVGGGSRQDQLPPAGDALHVHLDGLATIARLDAGDQTCSVDCGLRREVLDEALAAVGLELPCPGGGTLGGLFASDAIGAAAHGGLGPRSLLLGMDAMLADGTPFKSGARVVKSVAGFDVHKLFVGSQGRLFAALRLHLRLKPRPRAEQWFANGGLERDAALALVRAVRSLAVPPAALQFLQDADGRCTVSGRLTGRAAFVTASLRTLGLTASGPAWREALVLPAGGEGLTGLAVPSALPTLLAQLPRATTFLWHGGGRFEATVPDAAAGDALLATLAGLQLHGCVRRGDAARRGRGTPPDPGHRRLVDGLHLALDPHGLLV